MPSFPFSFSLRGFLDGRVSFVVYFLVVIVDCLHIFVGFEGGWVVMYVGVYMDGGCQGIEEYLFKVLFELSVYGRLNCDFRESGTYCVAWLGFAGLCRSLHGPIGEKFLPVILMNVVLFRMQKCWSDRRPTELMSQEGVFQFGEVH